MVSHHTSLLSKHSLLSRCQEYRGIQQDQEYIDSTRLMFKVVFPLNEIMFTFFDKLKAVTSGYGRFVRSQPILSRHIVISRR